MFKKRPGQHVSGYLVTILAVEMHVPTYGQYIRHSLSRLLEDDLLANELLFSKLTPLVSQSFWDYMR